MNNFCAISIVKEIWNILKEELISTVFAVTKFRSRINEKNIKIRAFIYKCVDEKLWEQMKHELKQLKSLVYGKHFVQYYEEIQEYMVLQSMQCLFKMEIPSTGNGYILFNNSFILYRYPTFATQFVKFQGANEYVGLLCNNFVCKFNLGMLIFVIYECF